MRSAIALASTFVALLLSCAPRPEASLIPADYSTWKKTTDLVLNYPIPGHENRLRIPRMNTIGFDSLPDPSSSPVKWNFATGTIIAKEIYASPTPGSGEGPVQVTAMIKAPGDPRARSSWIWVAKDLSTGKERVFTENFCVTCHANANEKHPYADKIPKGNSGTMSSSFPNPPSPSHPPPRMRKRNMATKPNESSFLVACALPLSTLTAASHSGYKFLRSPRRWWNW